MAKRQAKKKAAKKKATKKAPAKRGRPRIQLSKEKIRQLEELCKIGCTNDEISHVMGVSWDTLDRNYAEAIKKGRAERNVSLRRMQFKAAENGNTRMMIWLGKQVLGQREPPHQITGEDNGPVRFTFEIRPED